MEWTKDICEKLSEIFIKRQEDFREDFEFKVKAWERYTKKLGIKKADQEGICELYNQHEGVLLEDGRTMGWVLIPEELAEKSLALGSFPPRTKNQKRRTQ